MTDARPLTRHGAPVAVDAHKWSRASGVKLLNDDGSASLATALMMTHHGLRLHIAQFRHALPLLPTHGLNASVLRDEWQDYHETLHAHHEAEDTGLFPDLCRRHDHLIPLLRQLTADHRRIDPLLDRGDAAFADLGTDAHVATDLVGELSTLLDAHLAIEEAEIIPFLRHDKTFPPPTTEAETNTFADGFAWSSHGIAPHVLDRVDAMLPDELRSRLPRARDAFEARSLGAWGSVAWCTSDTSIPNLSDYSEVEQ